MSSTNFSQGIMVEFLNELIKFDKDMKSTANAVMSASKKQEADLQTDQNTAHESNLSVLSRSAARVGETLSERGSQMDQRLASGIGSLGTTYSRLLKCRNVLAEIAAAERAASGTNDYPPADGGKALKKGVTFTIDDLVDGKVDFSANAIRVVSLAAKGKAADAANSLYQVCRAAEQLLNAEINSLNAAVSARRSELDSGYAGIAQAARTQEEEIWSDTRSILASVSDRTVQQMRQADKAQADSDASAVQFSQSRTRKLKGDFLKKFPPQTLAEEYRRIYAPEPVYQPYECCRQQPDDVRIGTLEYDLAPLGLGDDTRDFLLRNYYFIYKGDKLCVPDVASFNAEFNYVFRFAGDDERSGAIQDACDLGLRLFSMIPPGKVNFTFTDPVSLGASFAMFGRLVDEDDRTIEVINGRIWSSPADIEQKLKTMTDHISNVTQRYLQGRYETIFDYNQDAEQNAEAYQVLMLMDFPAGMTDQSLRYLEQIVTSGPKCGVFTILFQNGNQYQKFNERSLPLVENAEKKLRAFDYTEGGGRIACADTKIRENPIYWKPFAPIGEAHRNDVISVLKKGIKTADKVVIDIEKVNERAEMDSTTADGIRIPIGIHGANEVQYLTLGVGGSHHALIAGVAGSGKSSLLHTIILRALTQYSPDELSIYLVDFKRGVEFKIYADYVLPTFKVVAIESEREFGYNILTALEREQKIRADMFKKARVDKIEEYRELGKKMPRILLIMDEFHELFSGSGDELSRKSAVIMERIVRQGRAFGVHLILSSQSYSNITGLDRAVFDQMSVRIVLKSSRADANLLLEDGSTEIDQISIDDPGRAVYNSEAGNREYNSHFRVAYIDPSSHRGMLEKISEETASYADPKRPTRILLSNIEDNHYSIFNQFTTYDAASYQTHYRLYLGEPLSINNSMAMDLTRSENANLLMIGSDTDKARSMFTFAVLSLCINYKVMHNALPAEPFITVLNCKPLVDDYFQDTLKLISQQLTPYVRYCGAAEDKEIQNELSRLYDLTQSNAPAAQDQYLLVFGYQRADVLKSEVKLSQTEDIDDLFNILPMGGSQERQSPKKMFTTIVEEGAAGGVHVLLWQDSFSALYQNEKDIMSYFSMKIAFDMTKEEYSRFVGADNTDMMNENNAIYGSRAQDNQQFRPYQTPDEEWLARIGDRLNLE